LVNIKSKSRNAPLGLNLKMKKRVVRMKEPIAIVGLGCRFPGGANSPEEFWDALCQKNDAISEVPPDRWNLERFYNQDASVPGTIQTRFGGFLDQIDQFDADFFGISPREAAALDPQQRLLLEVVWETLEDAGEIPEKLKGSRTGVYVGCFALDYKLLSYSEMQSDLLGAHTSIGASATILSNRISHFFDFHGPSMSIDTACSSSMVGVHLACRSIWEGETDLAVAAGANLIFKPEWTIATSKGGFLSPDGRCKAFDAKANGYVRSEGVGAILLKPLSQAREAGNRIYAVIRETASNQDGRTKGITVPSKFAQQNLMDEVYRKAGIAPAAVKYVEAHGTGTPTGDPIETGAIGAVFSAGRSQAKPCLIGSVKSNIGHLEAASGMAGIMKAALSLHHEKIPPNIHFETPNPDIRFDEWQLRVVTEIEPFPPDGLPRYVGVNSFGFGGSNVHVALEGAESYFANARSIAPADAPVLVPISAKSESALKKSVEGLRKFLAESNASLYDIAFNAARHREHHACRAGFVAASREELDALLDAFLADEKPGNLFSTDFSAERKGKIAFVFSGMGPQWWAMGRQLIAQEPVFRGKIKACDAFLSRHAEWSLLEELTASEEQSRIGETRIAQPAIFAIQVALASLLEAWGIEPDAVVGHSAGEVAAAHVAGALSLEDAVRVIYHRSRLQHQTEGEGRILAAGLSAQAAEKFLKGREKDVSLGAVNSPNSIALAGDEAVLDAIAAELTAEGIFCKMLYGKVPYHSPRMDPLKDELIASLAGLQARRASIPLYSTVMGSICDGTELSAAYWFNNIRNTVLFSSAIDSIIHTGPSLFLEISPHPVLSTSIGECLDFKEAAGETIPTLRRNQEESILMLGALAQLFVSGVAMDWTKIYPTAGNFLTLPHYPWERERYWVESEESIQYRLGQGSIKNFSGEILHPLLGARLQTGTPLWDLDLDLERLPFLLDHQVRGDVVYPGAAYVEAALAAAVQTADGDGATELAELEFNAALYLSRPHKSALQFFLDAIDGSFKIFGRTGKQPWIHHASGRIVHGGRKTSSGKANIEELKARCPTEVNVEELYRSFEERGLQYGPEFQGIRVFHRGEQTALAILELPEDIDSKAYHLHPSLLDAGFQAVLGILAGEDAKGLFLPVKIDSVRLYGEIPRKVVCLAEVAEHTREHLVGNLHLFDEAGNLLVEVSGFRCKSLGEQQTSPLETFSDDLYEYRWIEKAPPAAGSAALPKKWLVFADSGDQRVGQGFADELARKGYELIVIQEADSSEALAAIFAKLPETLYARQWGLAFCSSCGDFTANPQTSHEIAKLRERNEIRLLNILQAMNAQGRKPALFCLLTQGMGIDAPTSPIAASLWGMGRVLMNEHPNIRCILTDIDNLESIPALVAALESGDAEDEIAVHRGKRYVHRLQQVNGEDLQNTVRREEIKGSPYLIGSGASGFSGIGAFAASRQPPAAGEVEIEVHAAAILPSDLTGKRPVHGSPKPAALGRECAGIVVAVGAGVSRLKTGDAVIALAAGSCRSHLTLDARLVATKPASMEMTEAASVPFAYVSAWFGIERCAGVRAGEKALVCEDPLGIGLAALQIARRKGADVYAITGSEKSQALFAAMGAHHVFDSSSPTLTGDLLKATGGKGFDVVCHSASAQDLAASFSLLTTFGRFVELAGTDDGKGTDSGNTRRNLAYFRIDVSSLSAENPDLVAELMEDVCGCFERNEFLPPKPLISCPASKIADAHGPEKLIVLMQDDEIYPLVDSAFRVKEDATYLITGGVRGFGLTTAEWLVEKGARHLVLLGRSATLSPETQEAVERLRLAGVSVRTEAADVTDSIAMDRIFCSIEAEPFPLRGVIHAANVYADGYLAQMSEESFRRVYDPKALGAWNLHRLSRAIPLDFFVLFSSISAIVGNPGQVNYVAGNGFLSGLSRIRNQQGLPSLTVNWGAIADVGYLARNAAVETQLKETGLFPLPPHAALALLGELVSRNVSEITVAKVSWKSWLATAQSGKSPRFSAVFSETGQPDSTQDEASPLLEPLQSAPPKKRREIMEGQLLLQVAAILGMGKSRLPGVRQGFTDLGMDSMLSVELRNRLQKSYKCTLPATLLFLYPTIEKLAEYFLAEVLFDKLSQSDEKDEQPSGEMVSNKELEEQSIDDIAAMLEQKLSF